MMHLAEKFNFLDHTALPLVIDQFVFIVHLHGNVVAGFLMLSFLYNGIGALAEDFPKAIFTDGSIIQSPIVRLCRLLLRGIQGSIRIRKLIQEGVVRL
jgi:hypothetical protein